MALTGRRWFTIAILGCCTLVAVYWPGSTDTRPFWGSFFPPTNDIHEGNRFRDLQVRETRTMHTLLQLRDAAIVAMGRSPDQARPLAIRLSLDEPRVLARIAQATAAVTDFLAPLPEASQTIFLSDRGITGLGVADSSTRRLYGTWYLTPRATNGRVCLALALNSRQLDAYLRDSTHTSASDDRAALLRALGPCSFYTAFGVPGAAIEQWLRENNYAFAALADWDSTDALRQYQRHSEVQIMKDVSSGLSLIGLLGLASSRFFAMGDLSLPARACAHGRLDQCRTLLFSDHLDPPPPLGGRYAIGRLYWYADEPGAVLLSDLVRTQGRERFIQFWRSSLPVEQAFQQAFGVAIDEWTHQWLLGQLNYPHFGPTVRGSSVVVGLLIALLVIAAAVRIAVRRQVA